MNERAELEHRAEATEPGTAAPRLPAIDYIKAAAIVAVVFTHAGLPFWDKRRTLVDEILSGVWVNFQVPAFFVVSGFLYAGTGPIGSSALVRRMLRILCPYLVASVVVQVAGLSGAKQISDVLFQILTGSSLGIYYFVFLIFIFVVLSWPMSRMSAALLHVLLIALCTHAVLSTLHPELALPESFFWYARNPLHWYPYFLLGWVARLAWPEIAPFYNSNKTLILAACLGGIIVYAAASFGASGPRTQFLFRAVYSVSVVGLIASLTARSAPSSTVRFLSESSYAIYLYHNVFQALCSPLFLSWSPIARLLALVGVGLLGAGVVCAAGSRLLGRHSRLLLGT